MIRAILIDDEVHCSETLEIELGIYCPEIKVVGIADGAEEGIELIKKEKPDLIFLDIEMPLMNGFQLLEKLDDFTFDVIFVTAFDQYAVDAFRCSAIDYLLKPVTEEDLIHAVNKVTVKKNRFLSSKHFEVLLQNLRSKQEAFPRIVLPTGEGLEFIEVAEIIRLEADSNYCTLFLQDGMKLTVAKTLKEMHGMLKEHNFHRVHQSHLVNSLYLKRYVKDDGGYIEMKDGSTVSVSRSKKGEFFDEIRDL